VYSGGSKVWRGAPFASRDTIKGSKEESAIVGLRESTKKRGKEKTNGGGENRQDPADLKKRDSTTEEARKGRHEKKLKKGVP